MYFWSIFLVLEPFEVQRQDVGKLLDLHPLFSFLKITATIAEKLVLLTQHLAGAELTQASRHGRVLLDVDREVKERLVSGGNGFACQTSGFARQNALKEPVHDRGR
jgi:hypothetical protein